MPNSKLEILEKKEAELRKILEKEKEILLLEKVRKPDLTEKVMSFQYDHIDALGKLDLEQFLGALSQYHIFMVKYINQLSIAVTLADGVYERLLSLEVFSLPEEFKNKTLAEKVRKASQDTDLEEVEDKLKELQARLALYKNMPETIKNLTDNVKKVYDTKYKEKNAHD